MIQLAKTNFIKTNYQNAKKKKKKQKIKTRIISGRKSKTKSRYPRNEKYINQKLADLQGETENPIQRGTDICLSVI